MSAPWITYRPEIKVLDCTIRDGGLINDHMFDDGLVKAVYETCVEAGIDYMEVGYKAPRSSSPRTSSAPGSTATRTTSGGSSARTTHRSSSPPWPTPRRPTTRRTSCPRTRACST